VSCSAGTGRINLKELPYKSDDHIDNSHKPVCAVAEALTCSDDVYSAVVTVSVTVSILVSLSGIFRHLFIVFVIDILTVCIHLIIFHKAFRAYGTGVNRVSVFITGGSDYCLFEAMLEGRNEISVFGSIAAVIYTVISGVALIHTGGSHYGAFVTYEAMSCSRKDNLLIPAAAIDAVIALIAVLYAGRCLAGSSLLGPEMLTCRSSNCFFGEQRTAILTVNNQIICTGCNTGGSSIVFHYRLTFGMSELFDYFTLCFKCIAA